MFVEGASPSTHILSRFPLYPSVAALGGASVEEKGEINTSGFSGLVRPDSTIDGVSLVTSARLWQAVRAPTVVSAAGQKM